MRIVVGALFVGLLLAGCSEGATDAAVTSPTPTAEPVSAVALAEAAGCRGIKAQPITSDSQALGILDEVKCTLDGEPGGVSVVDNKSSLASIISLLKRSAYQLPKGTAYVAVGDTWYATTADDGSKQFAETFAETFAEANGGSVDSWPTGQ